MELRELKTFVAVASLLNFNQAANSLHLAQSTVSVRIRTLEDELGVRLFDRLGRRVVLTGAGERLLSYGRKLVEMEEEARTWVVGRGRVTGTVTIRVPESLCVTRMPATIRRFQQRYPGICLRLFPCAFNGLAEDLRRGVTDLAFVMATEVASHDMQAEFLGVEDLVLVAAPGHPLCLRPELRPRDFAGQSLVLSTADCSYRRMFEAMLAEAGVEPFVSMECGSVAVVRRFVAEGFGVTVLPTSAIRSELEAGTLVILPWTEGPLETAVFMLWHRDKWLSPALTAFMECCRESLMA